MAYLKLEGAKDGSIGIAIWIEFRDLAENEIVIDSSYLVEHNMNKRVEQVNIDYLFNKKSSLAPYYSGNQKGYYIFEIPKGARQIAVKGWGNTSYGKPYNVFVSNNGADYKLIALDAPNGAGQINVFDLPISNTLVFLNNGYHTYGEQGWKIVGLYTEDKDQLEKLFKSKEIVNNIDQLNKEKLVKLGSSKLKMHTYKSN